MTYEQLSNLVRSDNAPGITTDSRRVKPGDVFIAVKGSKVDGHDFIDHAVKKGARYIVCQKDNTLSAAEKNGCEVILVDDTALAAADLAQASFGDPASKLTNLAVTGTNGKTTVAFLVRRCLEQAGHRCGLIGTILYETGRGCTEAALTTPDCLALARMQSQMVSAGLKYMVIEASSHALAQNRLAGIKFKAAAFTNLAGDHMDYHLTKENYLDAKAKLFESLPPGSTAVLNKESPEAIEIANRIRNGRVNILWYAIDSPAELTARILSADVNGTVFKLQYNSDSATVSTRLPGRYNVCNHLAAAGLCIAAGLDLDATAEGLSALKAIPGRLEKIDWEGDFTVLIDYAHTDDALEKVLETLKPLCKGRLIVVFGCGGDRDKSKRPRMASVAERLADIVVVTSDNPRTEEPNEIIKDITAGFERPQQRAIIIEPDRRKAIETAIETATKDDIVLIAGKGHENYQIIGTERIEFSDLAVARQCLKRPR